MAKGKLSMSKSETKVSIPPRFHYHKQVIINREVGGHAQTRLGNGVRGARKCTCGSDWNFEEDMNKKKKRRKNKKSTVIEDIDEPYVCSSCSVIFGTPTLFETHLNGRKHAAKIKKHTKVLLDEQHIQEEIIQDNDHPKDMTEELRVKPGEAPENIGYLEKQRQELRERCATSERSVEEFFSNY